MGKLCARTAPKEAANGDHFTTTLPHNDGRARSAEDDAILHLNT